ncbi:MAG: hypothetical protein MN733_44350, partial [Nitrososphaera sp.]|nr:hypothetical protein [Nitrososphaera sp.]
MPTINQFTTFFAIAAVIVTALALRGAHITADTPAGLSSSDHGTYVDEGYKTLAPRNLLLFGADKWHPADTYGGWLRASPLTQWPYYLSFLASQPDIAAARTVTIAYYALFLVLYCFLLYGRYSPSVFYAGLLLFSLESTLFFFSRIALFEIPMVTLVYALLMFFKRTIEPIFSIALYALMVAAILAFSIKKSALVYFVPVFLAIVMSLSYRYRDPARLARYCLALAVGVVILLSITYDDWSRRLALAPDDYLIRLIDNPLMTVSPFIVLAGLFCAIYGVLYQPMHYFTNLYRLTLICLVILGPIILALFTVHPLRYYVPFLPASILISIEWLSLRKLPCELSGPNPVRTALAVFLLLLFTSYCVVALGVEDRINIMLLRNIMLLGILVVCTVFFLWIFRRVVFSKIGSLTIVLGFLTLGFAQSLMRIGDFLVNPSFGAEQVRHELIKIVNSDEVIAGDWAPFFALGTPIRALYSQKETNPTYALLQIKPQYFLH